MGTASRQATESMRRRPPAQCGSEDHGFDAVIVKRAPWLKSQVPEVSGKLPIRKERQQAVCVTESKCLLRSPQGDRAARKGIVDLFPGAEKRSSAVRVSDGRLEPTPEDSLHYSLLLGDGDINNRGEGDEGSNTPVCRLAEAVNLARAITRPDRACAKAGLFYFFGSFAHAPWMWCKKGA